jgi:hypothetical protein
MRQLIRQPVAPLKRTSIRFLRRLFPALRLPAQAAEPNHAEPSLHCPVVHDEEPNWWYDCDRNDIA